MPIILGPDGPSLGGFVCPATIVEAELWKIGQLKAGDTRALRARVAGRGARRLKRAGARRSRRCAADAAYAFAAARVPRTSPCWRPAPSAPPGARRSSIRQAGDALPAGRVRPARARPRPALPRPRADAALAARSAARRHRPHPGHPLAAGPLRQPRSCRASSCSDALASVEATLPADRRHRGADAHRPPAAVVGRPGDAARDREVHAVGARRRAVVPEQHRVHPPHQRPRRASTTSSAIVFDASYLVLGLGDVYLGAPVATPLDPRHRLVTTKYNPARTWTPENAVGIGGAYLCVYGMEGPGGYQFVGRTVQMWNRYRETARLRRRQTVAAALLRPDPLLPGQRRGAAGDPRRVPARPRPRCASRRRRSGSPTTARSWTRTPRRSRRSARSSARRSSPSASAGRCCRRRQTRPRWRRPPPSSAAGGRGRRARPVTGSVWKIAVPTGARVAAGDAWSSSSR